MSEVDSSAVGSVNTYALGQMDVVGTLLPEMERLGMPTAELPPAT